VSIKGNAEFAVLLGSGLGKAVAGFPVQSSVLFEEVVGLTAPGVEGHEGVFRICRVSGKDCLFILGRKHHYENKNDEICRLIRYAHSFGAKKLIVVSAAGSLSRRLQPGEFVLADRLLDLQMRPPLNIAAVFPPECVPTRSSFFDAWGGKSLLSLDKVLMRRTEAAARITGCSIQHATVACMPGPTYETQAEVGFLQNIDADVAAMSGAAEVDSANRLGMGAAVMCLITNYATHISKTPLSHKEVLTVSDRASTALGEMLAELISEA
jgi:purine-nucleoside phosphorylase